MAAEILTASRLRELFHYDPITGLFTRRVAVRNGPAGVVAGWLNSCGYIQITVDQKKHRAHRLALLYVNGEWPDGEVDHINGERADNRLSNLRDVSGAVNRQNRHHARPQSHSGLLGVWPAKNAKNPFQSRIRMNGKQKYLGVFPTAQLAHEAYIAARKEIDPFL
jgi:hypothetical protein